MIVDHERAAAALRRLAVPIAATLAADQLLGIADTIVVGALGASALAAVAAATSVVIVVAIALFGFTSGPRIIGAQAIGAGDMRRFGAAIRAGAVAPLGIAVAFAALAIAAGGPLLAAMLPGDASDAPAATYLALRAASLVPMTLSAAAITAFGASGDTTLGPRTLVVINLLHVPLLVVLALGAGTGHALGLPGAGIASLVSECAGAAFCARAVARRPALRILERAPLDGALVRATAALGVPEFVFLATMIVPEPIALALLAPAGVAAVDAFRALTLVSDLTWALPGSLGDAMEIVIGQRIGARDVPGAERFRAAATRLGVAACALAGATVAVLAWPLAALVTLHPAIASLAAAPLAVHALLLPLKGYAMAALAPIRASGDARFTLAMGVATSVVALAGIVAGIAWLRVGLWSIPLGWSVAWTLRCAITALQLRAGDWRTRELAA